MLLSHCLLVRYLGIALEVAVVYFQRDFENTEPVAVLFELDVLDVLLPREESGSLNVSLAKEEDVLLESLD